MQLKSRFSQISAVLIVCVLTLATLQLAWPRLKSSIRFLPVDEAIDGYFRSREIPSNRLLTLVGFAEEALDFHDHYRYHDGLSFLHYLRGLDIHTPALERRGAYRAAESAALQVVKRAPAQPQAWLRLATVRAILRDEPATILAPWKMSVFTGRAHSTLMVPRIGVGLEYLGVMDTETRAMLRDQLLLAWALKPADLLRELKRRDPSLQATRELIAGIDPAALAEMENRLEKVR